MRNLLNFIIKYISWLVFFFYVTISCILLFQSNSYQHHVYLTSANYIASNIYDVTSNVTSYFHLKDINEDLQNRNAYLENEIIELKKQLREDVLQKMQDSIQNPDFEYIMAEVINNSISKPFNYFTINKGKKDGIESEMGVVDQNGIVGIVNVVGENASRCISVLNPNFRISCKIKGFDYFGSLTWDGNDPEYAILEELPRHVKFNNGDTIITSGYSAVFPEGLVVGTIQEDKKEKNNNFLSVIIRLSTDFSQLSTVRILKSYRKEELDKIENDKFTN